MMEIIEKRLSELKHPEQNVRMHSQKQIKEYCRSISKYGQTKPMVIDEDGVILIGNGLYDALLALGRESGSCMVKAGLSEKEKKKLMLADNRIYSLGVDNMSVFDEIIAGQWPAGNRCSPGWAARCLWSSWTITGMAAPMCMAPSPTTAPAAPICWNP